MRGYGRAASDIVILFEAGFDEPIIRCTAEIAASPGIIPEEIVLFTLELFFARIQRMLRCIRVNAKLPGGFGDRLAFDHDSEPDLTKFSGRRHFFSLILFKKRLLLSYMRLDQICRDELNEVFQPPDRMAMWGSDFRYAPPVTARFLRSEQRKLENLCAGTLRRTLRCVCSGGRRHVTS
jgi:hypothetical protein